MLYPDKRTFFKERLNSLLSAIIWWKLLSEKNVLNLEKKSVLQRDSFEFFLLNLILSDLPMCSHALNEIEQKIILTSGNNKQILLLLIDADEDM